MIDKILLAFALYLPFQIALNPVEGIDLASIRIFVPLIFLIWLLQGLKKKKIIISFEIQTFLVLTFLFINTLSLLSADNANWGIRKLSFFFSIFPLYFVISGIKWSENTLYKFLKAIVWGSGAIALVGVFQFLSQFIIGVEKLFEVWSKISISFLGNSFSEAVVSNPSWLVNIGGKTIFRATSFFPDPHMLSFYLGMTFFIAISLYLTKKEKAFLALSSIIFLADLLTFSRGGYLGLLAGSFFTFLFFWNKLSPKYKKWLIIFLITAFVVGIYPNPISQRFLSSFIPSEGSNKERIETWSSSWLIVKENPVLGVGLGNYPLEIKPSADYREPIYSHNVYLDIAAETGILNAIVWIVLMFVAMGAFIKSKKSELKYIHLGLASGVIVFVTHSFFETAIFSVHILPLLIILVGLSSSRKENE